MRSSRAETLTSRATATHGRKARSASAATSRTTGPPRSAKPIVSAPVTTMSARDAVASNPAAPANAAEDDKEGWRAFVEDACARLGITIPEEARHTALGDAIVTAEVFLKLVPLLADKGIRTLREAREQHADPIEAVLNVTNGFRLFRGKVVDGYDH